MLSLLQCSTFDVGSEPPTGELMQECSSGPVSGRYVTITKIGIGRAIALCDLQVFGELDRNGGWNT